MIRTAFLRSSRALAASAVPRSLAPRCLQLAPRASLIYSVRHYSAGGSLSKPEIEGRITDLLKGFDKITDETKITATSHFSNDLGLDSLDTVEVVMAIEEEFSIEIPDKEADAIHSVEQAVAYIQNQPDAH